MEIALKLGRIIKCNGTSMEMSYVPICVCERCICKSATFHHDKVELDGLKLNWIPSHLKMAVCTKHIKSDVSLLKQTNRLNESK